MFTEMNDDRKKAVVLLSGGIDSATALAIARQEGYRLYALSFDYRQRHLRELESARAVAKALDVDDHLIVRFDLRSIGGSALTSDLAVPKSGTASVQGERSDIPATYVPARNTIFLSFGLSWAEVLGAERIFIGANAVDYSGYPDCRPEYLAAFEKMANLATKASVEGKMHFAVSAPLLRLKKSDIIRQGAALGLDFGLTWSCYDPQPDREKDLRPCMQCESCLIRARGFSRAGLDDPLVKGSVHAAQRST